MTRRMMFLAASALGVLALSACSQLGSKTTAQPTPAASAPASAAGSTSAKPSGKASAKPSASAGKSGSSAIPDICKLLTKAEITQLTGEQTTLMTDDGGANAASRYCQWQLSQGQVTITVSLEDREGFDVRNKDAKPVPGVGTTAYSLAGHLYVWEDGRDVDVYVSSESTDQGNLSVARRAAMQILPKLKAAAK